MDDGKVVSEEDERFRSRFLESIGRLDSKNLVQIKDGKIRFPAIGKEIDYSEAAKDRIDDAINGGYVSVLFDDFVWEPSFDEGPSPRDMGISDDDLPDFLLSEGDGGSRIRGSDKEIEVASAINANLIPFNDRIVNDGKSETSDVRFYCCQKGGGKHSDVMVVVDHRTNGVFNNGSKKVENLEDVEYNSLRSLNGGKNDGHPDKNDEVFFVEVKKTYDTAEYFKFNMRYRLTGDRAVPYDLEMANDAYGEFSKTLTKNIMDLWSKSEETRESFEEFNRNIEECIGNLMKIRGIQDKFKFRPIRSLPDDFEELSKVFNFYILEWTKRLIHLKSSYLYEIAAGNDNFDENADRIISQVELIRKKFLTLCNQTKIELGEIVDMDFVQKFKLMYARLVSSDRMKLDDDRNTQNLFSLTIDGNRPDSKKFLDMIEEYYGVLKNCRYIEIDEDLFKFSNISKTSVPADPFDLKPPDFGRISDVISMKITISVVKPGDGHGFALRLGVRLVDPRKRIGGKPFEKLDSLDCKFMEDRVKEGISSK